MIIFRHLVADCYGEDHFEEPKEKHHTKNQSSTDDGFFEEAGERPGVGEVKLILIENIHEKQGADAKPDISDGFAKLFDGV